MKFEEKVKEILNEGRKKLIRPWKKGDPVTYNGRKGKFELYTSGNGAFVYFFDIDDTDYVDLKELLSQNNLLGKSLNLNGMEVMYGSPTDATKDLMKGKIKKATDSKIVLENGDVYKLSKAEMKKFQTTGRFESQRDGKYVALYMIDINNFPDVYDELFFKERSRR